MEDREIIKALECCTNDDNEPNCKECTKRPHIYCICELLEDAYGLIQRQQKRIDRIVEQLEEGKNHCCVGCYEDYDPYEDGRFETYEEVIALLKGVQNE